MISWTKEQNKAITTRGSNLLVSAAAGSGKTAVLTERIMRILTEDEVNIDELLIVTFTKAAAGEMKTRILKSLSNKIEDGCINQEHLRKQISLLNKSYIMTLHSFCMDAIRKHFQLIDIDPAFRIGDITELSIMKEEALDEVLEKEYEKEDKSFVSLVEGYGGKKDDDKLRDLILKVYYFIQSKPYPQKWLQQCIEEFNIDESDFEKSSWIKTLKKSICIELDGAQKILNEALNLCDIENGPTEYSEALYDDLKNIQMLSDSISTSFDEFSNCLSNISNLRFKSIRKKRKKEIDEALIDEVKSLRRYYKDKIIKPIKQSIFSKSLDEHITIIKAQYPLLKYLYKIVNKFINLYNRKKYEKDILDFNDLEHIALQILEHDEVKKEYREKFKHIFVDEYQDSNIVQETIISRIKRKDNVFLVGDVKQSIYRFRLADPSIFIRKYNSYSDEDSGINRKIDLSKNFRSRLQIINCINYIFKNIMSKELGEIEYDKESYLYNGMEFKDIDNSEVEVNIIEKNSNQTDIDEELQEMSYVEIEAEIISNKIKKLIGKQTYDPINEEYRNIQYKDIAVLLRTMKNWGSVYKEVFAKKGIPVYFDDNSGYFDVIEIKVFINLLALIDNKRQDIPLLSVLRSPIGGFTTDDLIDIRLKCKEGSFYNAVSQYINENNGELKQRLARFISNLDNWANQSRFMKLDEFLWKILVQTGYYQYLGAMPGGKQRQANLRILVDRAGQFEKTAVNGLFLFIRFIDKLMKSKGDMGVARVLGENENVVRIMSIHKSKGLQFPVVICGGLGKQFNLQDTYGDVLLHKDLGIGLKHIDVEKRTYTDSLPQLAIKRKMKVESLSEEMRVLYVALTRAVDRLILVGSTNNIEKRSKVWCRGTSVFNLISRNNCLDWIMCVLSNHKAGSDIRNIAGNVRTNIDNKDENSKWRVRIYSSDDVLRIKGIKHRRSNFDKDIFKDSKIHNNKNYSIIDERFNWIYKYKEAVNIPSKLSVTDMEKMHKKTNVEDIAYRIPSLIKMPKFIEGQKSFTSAEKGTIKHFVMQHIDLNYVKSVEQIKAQVEDMVFNDLLTDEEAKVIDVNEVYNFFQSSIGKRVLKSSNVKREKPFVLRKKASQVIQSIDKCSDELLIQGIIDCYFEEDGDFVLIDYKSDHIFDNNFSRVVDKYRSQVLLYKAALENITNRRVKESYIYLFSINKAVKL